MVGARGFEPRTGGLKVRCDTISPYSVYGPYRRIRTDTSLIKSQVRYH